MAEYSFHSAERLKSRKSIEALFKSGRSFTSPPIRMFYRTVPDEINIKMAVAVPRRIFKRAVDRNLLKRRIRETYRQQKNILQEAYKGKQGIELLFLYQASSIADYKTIYSAVEVLLQRLISKANSNP